MKTLNRFEYVLLVGFLVAAMLSVMQIVANSVSSVSPIDRINRALVTGR